MPTHTSEGPAVVAFAAPSGTGKTTLITQLIEQLKARGHRVGAIKSDAHRVELDTPGKDTHRMRQSGSDVTAIVSRDQLAFFRDTPGRDVPLDAIVELFFSDVDIVLAEGFRSHSFPTFVIQRAGIEMQGWEWPPNVVALVSDDISSSAGEGLLRFSLDAIDELVSHVEGLAGRPAGSPNPTPETPAPHYACMVQEGQAPHQKRDALADGLLRIGREFFDDDPAGVGIAWNVLPRGYAWTAGEPSSSSIVIRSVPVGYPNDQREAYLRAVCALWQEVTGCSIDEIVATAWDGPLPL